MPTFIVERSFDPIPSQADLDATTERMAPCLELYGVRWIRSYWSQDRRRMVCHYEAVDAESVREVQREAAAVFENIWRADQIE